MSAAAERRLYLSLCSIAVVLTAASLRAQDGPLPEVGMSLRGVTNGTVEQGEPMRVAVQIRLDAPEGDDTEVVLASAAGSWADAIDVELIDSSGAGTGVRAQVVGSPESPVATLDRTRIAGGLWRFPANATSGLPPGDYRLRVRLVIRAAAPGSNGWTGEVSGQDLPVEVVAPSTRSGSSTQRVLSIAQDALLDDRLEEAAAALDELLVRQRDELRAWILRAVVSERAGNPLGALQAINEARLLYEALDPEEPLVDIEEIAARITAALGLLEPAQVDAAADWSWPPVALLTAAWPAEPPPELPPDTPPAVASTTPAAGTPPATNNTTDDAAPGSAGEPDAPGTAAAEGVPQTAGGTVSTKSAAAPAKLATVLPFAALTEAAILADSRGQWASAATASSEYAADRYNAMQATGPPNVDSYADDPRAWCHSATSNREDWLELVYVQPMTATELRVRQNYTPGTIARVEAFAVDGRAVLLWQGEDPNVYPDREITWFVLQFEPTPFPITRIRLTLDIARIGGWKQIDAVQLIGPESND